MNNLVSSRIGEGEEAARVPFLSSIVTVSLAHFIKNLEKYRG